MSIRRKITPASPFGWLLGLRKPPVLPVTASMQLVVCGRRVSEARQLRPLVGEDDVADGAERDLALAMRRKLTTELRRIAAQAADKRWRDKQRARGEAIATRSPEKQAEYSRRYYERHRDRVIAMAADAHKRRYYADLEASRARARDYYAKNREQILAKQRAAKARLAKQQRADAAPAAEAEG
ncbi:MAG: hypothetical protein AMXMBFR78_34180 [Rubrivivax sp.]